MNNLFQQMLNVKEGTLKKTKDITEDEQLSAVLAVN